MFVITFNYPHFDLFLHACGSARDKDGAVSALHRNVETRSFSLSIHKHIDIEFISLNAQMAFYYLIKLVWFPLSVSGSATPAALPASKHLIIHARFLARFLMVCMPSASCSASPGTRPCTRFQYVEPATGICDMPKYLFSTSNVADVPPRLATATDAPGLYSNAFLPL